MPLDVVCPAMSVQFSRKRAAIRQDPLEMGGILGLQHGGLAGQVDAIKMAIAKAITVGAPDLRGSLKKAELLRRDSRKKERKKYGLRSARKREQYSKR